VIGILGHKLVCMVQYERVIFMRFVYTYVLAHHLFEGMQDLFVSPLVCFVRYFYSMLTKCDVIKLTNWGGFGYEEG